MQELVVMWFLQERDVFVSFQLVVAALASYLGPSESLIPRPHGNEARQSRAPFGVIINFECQYGLS